LDWPQCLKDDVALLSLFSKRKPGLNQTHNSVYLVRFSARWLFATGTVKWPFLFVAGRKQTLEWIESRYLELSGEFRRSSGHMTGILQLLGVEIDTENAFWVASFSQRKRHCVVRRAQDTWKVAMFSYVVLQRQPNNTCITNNRGFGTV